MEKQQTVQQTVQQAVQQTVQQAVQQTVQHVQAAASEVVAQPEGQNMNYRKPKKQLVKTKQL